MKYLIGKTHPKKSLSRDLLAGIMILTVPFWYWVWQSIANNRWPVKMIILYTSRESIFKIFKI